MHWRRIVVDSIVWRYHVGDTHVIAIRSDDKMRRMISFAELTGLTWDEVERGKHKRWLSITPELIANWLYDNDL